MTSRFSVANMGIFVIKIEKGRSKIFSDLPQLSDLGRGGGGSKGEIGHWPISVTQVGMDVVPKVMK